MSTRRGAITLSLCEKWLRQVKSSNQGTFTWGTMGTKSFHLDNILTEIQKEGSNSIHILRGIRFERVALPKIASCSEGSFGRGLAESLTMVADESGRLAYDSRVGGSVGRVCISAEVHRNMSGGVDA